MRTPHGLNSGSLRPRRIAARLLRAAALLALSFPGVARANPEGARVVAGGATVARISPTELAVVQTTPRAILDWQSFSIAADESTRFHQPSATAVALNRVVGRDPSLILGRLSADGRVFLVNPAGIVFGTGCQVDVSGLVASTADIGNDDFLADRLEFRAPGDATAGIVNQGTITAADGGLVALVAPWIRNEGTIVARLGRVALAGAETFTLDLYGDRLVEIATGARFGDDLRDADGNAVATQVANGGTIQADGGSVRLDARAAGRLLDCAIGMAGVVEARSLSRNAAGTIVLDGGEGSVRVCGRLDAGGGNPETAGGRIEATGQRVILTADAVLDASGPAGGGTLHVGGGWQGHGDMPTAARVLVAPGAVLAADATIGGDGGEVVVWGDELTAFGGKVSAKGGGDGGDGGRVEISGARLAYAGTVDTLSPGGRPGSLLLDPTDLRIVAAGAAETADLTAVDDAGDPDLGGDGDVAISVAAIAAAGADVVLAATRDIVLDAYLAMASPGVGIALTAGRDILLNQAIRTQGGHIVLTPDANGDHDGAVVFGPGTIATGGGSFLVDGDARAASGGLLSFETGGGDLRFGGDLLDPAGTANFDLDAGNAGTVTLDGDLSAAALNVYNCLDFLNNGTVRAVDVSIAVQGDADVGDHTVNGSDSIHLAGAGGALAGSLVGGTVGIAGFGIVNVAVNVTNLTIGGTPSGSVSGTVSGTATVPGSMTDNTGDGGNKYGPPEPLPPDGPGVLIPDDPEVRSRSRYYGESGYTRGRARIFGLEMERLLAILTKRKQRIQDMMDRNAEVMEDLSKMRTVYANMALGQVEVAKEAYWDMVKDEVSSQVSGALGEASELVGKILDAKDYAEVAESLAENGLGDTIEDVVKDELGLTLLCGSLNAISEYAVANWYGQVADNLSTTIDAVQKQQETLEAYRDNLTDLENNVRDYAAATAEAYAQAERSGAGDPGGAAAVSAWSETVAQASGTLGRANYEITLHDGTMMTAVGIYDVPTWQTPGK